MILLEDADMCSVCTLYTLKMPGREKMYCPDVGTDPKPQW